MAIHQPLFARLSSWSVALALAASLGGCGGGGSGPAGVSSPAPTVSLSASQVSIAQGGAATLTWSSTNATACTASQGWSGAKAISGSESTGALNATTTFSLSCSGGGGSASQSVTVTVVGPPTVTFNATSTTVAAPGSTTLTWSSTDATSCTATDGWTGTRAASGSEEVGPLTANATFTLTCTGLGGTSAPQSIAVAVTPPPAGSAVVTGKIQFERIPFDTVRGTGLNPDGPVLSPARGVVVEAMPAGGGAALATTVTNASGNYGLLVPENSNVFIRARAQMLRTGSAPTWNFQVKNNTNSDALYVLDGSAASVGTGATRNLTAPSGWGSTSYTGTRAAAPFAILDTVYQAKELIRSVSGASFAPLDLFWSPNNRGAEPICPSTGQIGTTSYNSGGNAQGGCELVEEGIYVLGDFANGAGDTDEFDQHVIAHEFGHYVEAKFSRSDSIGGQHGAGNKLDLRVAFGEAWGDAFAGMVLNDPVYRDSFDGMSKDFSIDLEQDDTRFDDGWFSETSVGEILWDLFDTTNESGDSASLGFQPIFAALVQGQRTTPALTSVFSFLDALRDVAPGEGSAITQLRNGEQISGTDEFGTGETNNGGDPNNLPVYRPITLNSGQQHVCTRATNGTVNKLGNNKFFKLDLANAALVTISLFATVDPNTPGSTAAVDPDVYLHRQGDLVAFGVSTGATETISQQSLPAGTYIIEVLDAELGDGDPPRCMTVNVVGGA